MNSLSNTSRALGAAFLFQAITSLISGVFLLKPLIVPGNITYSMINISNNVLRVRAEIVGWTLTAFGIVVLSALLYLTLNKQSKKIALVAFGVRLVEATILVASRMATFALLLVSQESVKAGHPAYLQSLGKLFYELWDLAITLDMAPYALGATLFYYLFFKSGFIPRWLSIWGLVVGLLAIVGILFSLFGYTVPIIVFLPGLPFELTIGVWLMVKGIRNGSETK